MRYDATIEGGGTAIFVFLVRLVYSVYLVT